MVKRPIVNHVLLLVSLGAIANPAIAEEPINIPQSPLEPSLWWKVQRLQEGWVDNISINPDKKQAIVKINTSRWIASDYLQRFSFLFKLGTEAQKQNFNVLRMSSSLVFF